MSLRITCNEELSNLIKKGMLPKGTVIPKPAKLNQISQLKENIPKYTPLPCNEPAVILFRALINKYGSINFGGSVAWELENIVPGRKWRLDIAFPQIKVGIEMDGWEWHGKHLSSFKRDREKDFEYKKLNWVIIRVSAEMVNCKLTDTLAGIDQIISHKK